MSHLSEERAFWAGVFLTQLFGLDYSTVWVLFRFNTTRQMRQIFFPVYFPQNHVFQHLFFSGFT